MHLAGVPSRPLFVCLGMRSYGREWNEPESYKAPQIKPNYLCGNSIDLAMRFAFSFVQGRS